MLTTPPATDEQVDAAILAALAPTGDELVRWKAIEPRVPGGFWQKAQACQRLYDFGRIYVIKIGGTPYMGLADECDRQIAARYRAEGRTRRCGWCERPGPQAV
jgi:hypothetical protein